MAKSPEWISFISVKRMPSAKTYRRSNSDNVAATSRNICSYGCHPAQGGDSPKDWERSVTIPLLCARAG